MKKVVFGIAIWGYLLIVGATAHAANLAVNGDFTAGNTGFTSQMIYEVSPQPPGEPLLEGHYSVSPDPYDVHKAALSFGDHTTGDGLMLVANGSNTSKAVWSQEITVVPGETYHLNFWAATWSEFSPGSLLVLINGVQVGSVFSLPSIRGQWTEFTHDWSSGSATTATVVIKNFTTFSIGNDFAIDDIALSSSGPELPGTIVLSDLIQTYNGMPRPVTATTTPTGMEYTVTYDGEGTPPTNAGDYTVIATITDPFYTGSVTGTLSVAKADQAIDFSALADQLATATVSLEATATSGLPVAFSVEAGPATLSGGTALAFTGAGQVTITATQTGSVNWNAATPVTHSFNVTRAPADVALDNLSQTYNGTPRVVMTTTTPNGLATTITYNGKGTAPTNAGDYTIIATLTNPLYVGSGTGTLSVAKADQTIAFPALADQFTTATVPLASTATSGLPVAYSVEAGPATLSGGTLTFTGIGQVTVTATQAGDANWNAAAPVTHSFNVARAPADMMLNNLSQTYDGTPRVATATTNPDGLVATITYDDSAIPPTDAGEYTVIAILTDPVYVGAVTGTLSVAKANQVIAFPALADQFTTATVPLTATATSGLPVAYGVTGPAVLNGDTLTFTGRGSVSVTASQPGDANWNAAHPVTQTFHVAREHAVALDFDGDGRSDLGCYYAPGGNWYFFQSTDGFKEMQFGYEGTLPVTGDFDKDGVMDFGCYYPPGGNWYFFNSTIGFRNNQFGYEGTLPVTGDFNGDGRIDIGCYHPPSGNWYFFHSSDGFRQTQFGYEGTLPVIGDFDGDKVTDFGCYHPPSGNWYFIQSTDGFKETQFGYEGTLPIVGDFDGDGRADFGCYHPPSGKWYFFQSTAGFKETQFGYEGTRPVVGDFDGDGVADFGCYHPPSGNWYLMQSTEGLRQTQFGYAGTVPVK